MSNIRPAGYSDEEDSDDFDYEWNNPNQYEGNSYVEVKEEVKDPQQILEELANQAVFGKKVNNKRLGKENGNSSNLKVLTPSSVTKLKT